MISTGTNTRRRKYTDLLGRIVESLEAIGIAEDYLGRSSGRVV